MKKVLSIAGSDCSGGAGIQADLKTFSAHGVFGMSVIVSVVAENTSRVIDIQDITPDMIEKQIDAVFEDIEVDAVKIGMLSTPECMKAVAKKLLQYKPQNVVIDPVMYAKNGCPLMNPTAVSTLIDTVIPLADVLTPNIPEAEKIADMQISTVSDMEAAARKIYAMGCKAIVVKGGHHIGNAVDVLFDGENFYHFETSRIDTKNTHGTGCTFSSAIASQLAKGKSVPLAVESAKAYVTMAIEHSLAIGKGCGPTHHFYELYIDIQFLKKRNLPVPENYVTEICARSFEEAAQYTIDLFGLQETVEGIIEEWNNMAVEEYSNHVGLLPYALDYLLCLKEHGIKLAVATGLPEKLYIPCLKNNSILELFGALCSTDEVQRGKEYSDVFELAARKLGVAPEHCIVFDDVLPAIKSAKAARMLAGGIYDKYSADQRTEIERIADIYLLDFRQAPIPHKEV